MSELSTADRSLFFNDVKTIYHAIAEYLRTRLPLKSKFLRDVQVLHPSLKAEPNSPDQMIRVGRAIPGLLSDTEIDRIRGEWLMYASEAIDVSWYRKNRCQDPDGNSRIKYHRIDIYWSKLLSLTTNAGSPKYPTMAKIIKNVLIVSHGNSDVERGFSINEHMVTENRTLLSASSINGLRATRDALNLNLAGCLRTMPIKPALIRAVQKSKSIYSQEQSFQKAAANQVDKDNEVFATAEEESKTLIDQEHHWLSKQESLQNDQKKAQCLISEGRQRLDSAFKRNDMFDAQAANALIGAGDEQVKLDLSPKN